ncbi:transglycosylase domain-containing protein [Brevibacillus fulvus]|uniref:Penicillin-binding protein 2A n=1 Tax=Brevibacillus fulvus TaxID=1125967 RepID=A0A939BSI3_9BACL|nr:PBP1A family penicillin-binding protein [Brevibacillus fulvus]MBM7590747.1 penicillin-binding protein 2A [Brevibacillus fulvus]
MAKAKKKSVKKKMPWLMLIIPFCVFLLVSVVGGYYALLYAGGQMIDLSKLEQIKTEPSIVYDKDGNPIGNLYIKEERKYVSYTEIPKHVINAFVSVEDKRFFEHNGVDIVRIAGAILKDIQAGAAVEGGSTITQQLAKNVFLSQEKTFWRKTKEVSIAISLENNFTKEQIMEMYLNQVYLGHGIAGVGAAAQFYFHKDVKDLDYAEAAMLAAIPKAPSYYSPFNDPDRAKERRDTILRLMNEQNYITKQQKEAAQNEPLPVRTKTADDPGIDQNYQAYIDYVIDEAKSQYQIDEETLYRGGWHIYTAFDKKVQDAMVNAFNDPANFPADGKTKKVEASMVVVDPKTGGLAAMMGGRNYQPKGYNLATDMRRQPGSTFKPLVVYAPALETGEWSASSRLSNKRQSFNGYQPRNYNGKYSESVSMKDAVTQSLNIPAVWLLQQIGIEKGLLYAEKFGIKLDPEDRNLAIALGGLHSGTSPLQMAQAYTAFANEGIMSKAHAIVRLEDPEIGYNVTADVQQTRVISESTAWKMHSMLRNVIADGTGKSAKIAGRPLAGKTGSTTSEVSDSSSANKDVWFVGYTPEYVGAVWMGFDKEDSENVMKGGSSFPAKVFGIVMRDGLKGVKSTGFAAPEEEDSQPEKTEEPKEEALQLAADMTILDNGELAVVLSWIGGQEGQSYNLYRYVDDPAQRELVAAGIQGVSYQDHVEGALPYRYILIEIGADGQEGEASNVATINTATLEKLLQDAKEHNDENIEDGQLPEDQLNGGDDTTDQNGSWTDEPSQQGTDGQTEEEMPDNSGDQGDASDDAEEEEMQSDDQQDGQEQQEIELPPPPTEESTGKERKRNRDS